MQIQYSIIIPHHNIIDLLRRCLRSIPIRNDVEVIVVDDYSTSEVRQALVNMEAEFTNVRWIYTDGCRGAGYARNLGLKQANGKYVLFADADDYFNYCLNQLLDDYTTTECDAIFFNANSVDTNTYVTAFRAHHLNKIMDRYEQHPSKAIYDLKYKFGEPWCKIVRRDIIERNGIEFSETKIHNDTKYSYLVGHYCQEICVDRRAVYCVTDRLGSVSKVVSLNKLFVRTSVFAEANRFFRENGIACFDSKALRAMVSLGLNGDLRSAGKFWRIQYKSGLSNCYIVYRLLRYPFYGLAKIWEMKYKLFV